MKTKPNDEHGGRATNGKAQTFYILSLKWTKQKDENATWWRPDSKGYTTNLEHAGIYTEAQIAQRHYNDGVDTIAVPVELAREFARTTVDAGTIKGRIGAIR